MVVIDRFEGEWAVLEYQDLTFNFPKELLPEDVAEGDILDFTISIDQEKTLDIKENLQKRLNSLFDLD